MAVNLSFIGGAGWQFFDNNGVILSGGKIYTYAAGTTTPLATYTARDGSTPNTNPIILDAAGRTPQQIWSTEGLLYKYVLTDANNTLIRTWDNIGGSVVSSDLAQTLAAPTGATLIGFTGFKGQIGTVASLATSAGANWIGYKFDATASVARSISDRLQDFVSVKDFGATGDGVTDDTNAINAAIAYALTAPITQFRGRTVYFPAGIYAVTEINLSNTTPNFNRSVRLLGEGRWASRIVPFSSGTVLLNMLGRNVAQVESLHFDSDPATSGNTNIPQCAIFLARSVTSSNCNNNNFRDVWISGNYSVASVVSNGSESSNWFGGRIENSNAAANHRCLWTGGGALVGPLQNVIVANGGTVKNTDNPNTDNAMFGVEFYAPFNNATLIRITSAAGYVFEGCTLVLGTTSNSKFVLYDNPIGSRINGPIQWIGCHFEGFGTNNVVHYFDLPATGETTIDSVHSLSGSLVVNDGTNWIDFDRTNPDKRLTLYGSNFQRIGLPPGVSNLPSYVNVLNRCTFYQQKSTLVVFDFMLTSNIVVDTFNGSDTVAFTVPYEVLRDTLPTNGQWMRGTTITKQTPVVGQPVGWKVTASGTAGTLNSGVTTIALTVASSFVVPLSSPTDLFVGCKLNIGGTTRYVRAISGSTVYLNASISGVAGSPVSFSPPTFVAMANL